MTFQPTEKGPHINGFLKTCTHSKFQAHLLQFSLFELKPYVHSTLLCHTFGNKCDLNQNMTFGDSLITNVDIKYSMYIWKYDIRGVYRMYFDIIWHPF